MAYEVFEAVVADGDVSPFELVAESAPLMRTRVVGTYATWGAALRTVAQLEAQARLKRGGGGFAVGIRSEG
jgi:hypothetical protein